jgi:nitroreductase
VDDARWAPSSHNTQPWTFRRTAEGLELVADATRSLPEVDPDFRELVVSGGAALHHLRVALRGRGHTVSIESLPEDAEDPVLARLRLTGAKPPGPEDAAMLKVLRARHTDRGPYVPEHLAAKPLDELRTLAADEGARLTVVTDPAKRAELARLVEAGDRMQARASVLREAVAWTRVFGRHRDDGLPPSLTIGAGRHRPRRERDLVETGPALAVVATPADEPHDWLAAGRALSAVALGATARGLSVSFFDAPVEEPQLRGQVAEAAGAEGFVQLLLRLGHGEGGPPSPRRSLDDVSSGTE